MWNISKPAACACACVRAVDHAKFKTTKIYSQGIWSIIQKFAPIKISRYTVASYEGMYESTHLCLVKVMDSYTNPTSSHAGLSTSWENLFNRVYK